MEYKPYKHEHAARVRDPKDFVPDSFRRKTIEDGIDIIIGKLKTDPEGAMVVQTYRFDAEKFSAAEAKEWLKKHDIKYISFEEAKKMNTEYYLTKDTSGGSVKDVDVKQGIVTGYFAIFGNVDADNDIIMPGAAKKTIEENGPDSKKPRIMHLLQHDIWRPLAKPHVLKEDNKGIYFESKISETSYGRDAIKLYEDQVLSEHSIGFQLIKHEMNEETGVRTIKEIKLWEGSTVTWGANAEALVVAVKQKNGKDVAEKIIKKIDAINHAMKGNYTDETFRMLEIELKQLQQIIVTLVEKLEPVNTRVEDKPLTSEEMLKILLNKIN